MPNTRTTNKTRIALAIVGLLLLVVILAFYAAAPGFSPPLTKGEREAGALYHAVQGERVTFTTRPWDYDRGRFLESIQRFESVESSQVWAMVVPHHELASDLIAEAFQAARATNPKTVMVLGPNHFEAGDAPVITGALAWQTQEGTVEPELRVVEQLVEMGVAAQDEQTLWSEHAVGTLTPYIARTWPEASIIPLIVKANRDAAPAQDLARNLLPYLDGDTLLIASIDFSHYLPLEEANRRDAEVERAINARDYAAIAGMNSDYLDSAPSLIAFLAVADALGTEVEVLNQGNSADIEAVDVQETTSYFTILAR